MELIEADASVWIFKPKPLESYEVQEIVREPLTNTFCEFIVIAR